jgi:hypothetical protein
VRDTGTVRLSKHIDHCAPAYEYEECGTGETVTADAVVWRSSGSNDPEENGISYLVTTGDGIYRVRQERQDLGEPEPEVVRAYAPGFLRFPLGPLAVGDERDDEHLRCEDDTTEDPPTHTEEPKRYHFVVESFDTVDLGDAGVFPDAVAIRRENLDSHEVKRFWFAPGVGKVLEQELDGDEVLREERLVSFEAGTEACTF